MRLERRKADNPCIQWSSEDETVLLRLLKKDETTFEDYKLLFPERVPAGLKAKIRRLRIKHDLFGASYRTQKEEFTRTIGSKIKPGVVFDAFAGAGHQTFEWITNAKRVYAADKVQTRWRQFRANAKKHGFQRIKRPGDFWEVYSKDSKQIHFYCGDALDAAAVIRLRKIKIDLLDLDTCGSTIPLLPTLLTLVKPRHLVITHGEFHSMRFNREDVLRRLLTHRDINESPLPIDRLQLGVELDKAVKTAGLRAGNETTASFWLKLVDETWLANRMLRRHYAISRPAATADCLNAISGSN